MTTSIDDLKNAARNQVWAALTACGAVHDTDVYGRIPNFVDSHLAADRLAALPAWQSAGVVKAVPDKAQLPVRARALREGKIVYMAVPKLAKQRPFYLLDPEHLTVPPEQAADSHVAADIAPTVDVDSLLPIDLIVCGSVAVNRHGVRLGKGAGYSDLEVALLQEAGLIRQETVIATTVHSLQVVDGELPESEHDFSVDLIVTPDEVINCAPRRRSPGLLWECLPAEKIAAIPALASRASAPRRS
ncbi:5-formyltetrahydrofolate cyclo-ligase [Actinokineospora terrae]|uniref:5-formyltetrahydrofolate cyclo-ligase n=1 Tax=Actinokineospora terrae TaxID=155974 RepID=A0A1H9WQI2_9PSEU|nr:5-formyltetrahydrofolate cyclo-ligase [Actinokineospora terrae]SES36071.1 5-formyltetrahydrofolate cyclo-ligase [Actinokineospora terrae]